MTMRTFIEGIADQLPRTNHHQGKAYPVTYDVTFGGFIASNQDRGWAITAWRQIGVNSSSKLGRITIQNGEARANLLHHNAEIIPLADPELIPKLSRLINKDVAEWSTKPEKTQSDEPNNG